MPNESLNRLFNKSATWVTVRLPGSFEKPHALSINCQYYYQEHCIKHAKYALETYFKLLNFKKEGSYKSFKFFVIYYSIPPHIAENIKKSAIRKFVRTYIRVSSRHEKRYIDEVPFVIDMKITDVVEAFKTMRTEAMREQLKLFTECFSVTSLYKSLIDLIFGYYMLTIID